SASRVSPVHPRDGGSLERTSSLGGNMKAILVSVGSLILGISLIQLANGYVGTLVGIRLAAAEVEPVITGVVTSAFFVGYAAGAVLCTRLIYGSAHIRAFAAFAALVAAAVLAQS